MGTVNKTSLHAILKKCRDEHKLLEPLTTCPKCNVAIDEIINEEQTSVTPSSNFSQRDCHGVRISHNCGVGGSSLACDDIYLCTKHLKYRKGQLPNCKCRKKEQIPAGAHTQQHVSSTPNDNDGNDDYDDTSGGGGLPSDMDGYGDADDDDKEPSTAEGCINLGNQLKIVEHIGMSALSEKSKKYLIRDLKNKDGGKIGLVVDALVDNKVDGDPKFTNMEQVNKHLFTLGVYHKSPTDLGKDITAMTNTLVEEHKCQNDHLMGNIQECIKEAVVQEIKKNAQASQDGLDIDALSNTIVSNTMKSLKTKQDGEASPSINLTDHAAVNRSYLNGVDSILQNLPIPDVKELHGFYYIPLEQIVNLSLALGLDVLQYSKDDDKWGGMEGRYYHDLHQKFKESGMSDNTRMCILRAWSDGFQAFQLKADSEHNNLQLFTVTLLGKDGKNITWPFALGFKTDDHSPILNQLLEEAHALLKETNRYCGKAKEIIPFTIELQFVMNDYPERTENTFSSNLGRFTKRWGWSCDLNANTVPSCHSCWFKRINNYLDNAEEMATAGYLESHEQKACKEKWCIKCTDWLSSAQCHIHENTDNFPKRITDTQTQTHPTVKLNFQILHNACKEVGRYLGDKKNSASSKPTKSSAKEYLQFCGVQAKLGNDIIDTAYKGNSIEDLIPKIWVNGQIQMSQFIQLPLHQLALGVEKKLLVRVDPISIMSSRISRDKKNALDNISNQIRKSIKLFDGISIAWCDIMQLAKAGTPSSWLAKNYTAFTRTSLVHFGPLGRSNNTVNLPSDIADAFKEMRVLWFCLMSHMMAEEKVSPDVVDDLVKLFLSSCVQLHHLTPSTKKRRSQPSRPKTATKKRKISSNTNTNEQAHPIFEFELDSSNPKEHETIKDVSKILKQELCDEKKIENIKELKPTKKVLEFLLTKLGFSKTGTLDVLIDRLVKQPVQLEESFFEGTQNFYGLLNVKETMILIGSLRHIWEGTEEGFIQFIKRELTSFRNSNKFMKTILLKQLRTFMLKHINKDNPLCDKKTYARTLDFTVYNQTTCILEECIVSGLIVKEEGSGRDKFYVCKREPGSDGKICLTELIFRDKEGFWLYNLWYAPVDIISASMLRLSREEALAMPYDYFLLMRQCEDGTNQKPSDNSFTMICRSWRIRDNHGNIRLPTPQKECFCRVHSNYLKDPEGSVEKEGSVDSIENDAENFTPFHEMMP